MKTFDRFIGEAAAKRCPVGKYWCFTDKKCKKIPSGYHVGRGGYLEQDSETQEENGGSGGDGNGNGGNDNNGGRNGGGGE